MLKTKAISLCAELKEKFKDADTETKQKIHYSALLTFTASSGWYDGFARRYGLVSGKLSGESASAPIEIAKQGQEDLQKILEEYDPGASCYSFDIFHCSFCFVLLQKIFGIWMKQHCFGSFSLIAPLWFRKMFTHFPLFRSFVLPLCVLSFVLVEFRNTAQSEQSIVLQWFFLQT